MDRVVGFVKARFMRGGGDSFSQSLLDTYLPISLGLFYLSGAVLTGQQEIMRGLLFGLGFLLGLISPRMSFVLAPIFAVTLEGPTLWLGFRNQFVFEFYLGGWLLIHGFRAKPISIRNSFPLSLEVCLIFAVSSGYLIWLASFGVVLAGISHEVGYIDFWIYLINEVFDWSPFYGVFHSLSIVVGIFTIFLSLRNFFRFPSLYQNPWISIQSTILLVGLVVLMMAYLQRFEVLPLNSQNQISGPFQSGNHVSFFSGLLIISAVSFAINALRSRSFGILFCSSIIGFMAIPVMFWGGGRTAVVSLFFVISVISLVVLFLNLSKLSMTKFLLLGISIISCVIVVYSVVYFSVDLEVKQSYSRIRDIFFGAKPFSIISILEFGGRGPHLTEALNILSELKLTGIGLGQFVRVSEGSYPIHFSFLSWLVELGPITVVVFLVGLFLLLIELWSLPRHAFLTASALLVFTGVVLFMDPVLGYRSILFFFIFLYVAAIRGGQNIELSLIRRGVQATISIALLSVLVWAINYPSDLIFKNRAYPWEDTLDGRLEWVPVSSTYSFGAPPGDCYVLPLFSPPGEARLLQLESKKGVDFVEIGSGQSLNLCQCHYAGKAFSRDIKIRGTSISILSIRSTNQYPDGRILSFGSRPMFDIPNDRSNICDKQILL